MNQTAVEIARGVLARDAEGFCGPLTLEESQALETLQLRAANFERHSGVRVELGRFLRARLMLPDERL